jgi:hypothetical protein
MGGIDEVYIVNAFVRKFVIYLCKALYADLFAEIFVGYGLILAKTALQRTAGEKNGARTPCAGDDGFFIVMGRSAGNDGLLTHSAEAFAPRYSAFAGTYIADIAHYHTSKNRQSAYNYSICTVKIEVK